MAVAPTLGEENWYRAFGPDGNHFIVTCKAAVREMDTNHNVGTGTGTRQDAYDVGFCQGLVNGVASSMNSDNDVDLVTSNPSTNQLIRVVEKYMDDHPEQLSKPAVWLIRVALQKAFPSRR